MRSLFWALCVCVVCCFVCPSVFVRVCFCVCVGGCGACSLQEEHSSKATFVTGKKMIKQGHASVLLPQTVPRKSDQKRYFCNYLPSDGHSRSSNTKRMKILSKFRVTFCFGNLIITTT